MSRRLNVKISEELYVELVRRYGVRGLSKGIEELLRRALGMGEASKTSSVQTSKTHSVLTSKTLERETSKTSSVLTSKTPERQTSEEEVENCAGAMLKLATRVERENYTAYQVDRSELRQLFDDETINIALGRLRERGFSVREFGDRIVLKAVGQA